MLQMIVIETIARVILFIPAVLISLGITSLEAESHLSKVETTFQKVAEWGRLNLHRGGTFGDTSAIVSAIK